MMPGMTASDRLTYRLFRDEDLPAVLRLWEEHSGWGGITEDQWREWYIEAPFAPSRVVVAADDRGEIVGQLVLTPTRVRVGERVVDAARISAPILHQDFRWRRLRHPDHPITRLLDLIMEIAIGDGLALVYAMPEYAWRSFFRWYPRFESIEFGCVSVPIPESSSRLPGRFTAAVSSGFGDEHTTLWKEARAAFPIEVALERSVELLRYKNRGHLVFDIRDDVRGVLAGYAAIHRRTGLLVDFMADAPAHVAHVLSACLDGLASLPDDQRIGLHHVKAMPNSILGTALDSTGFQAEEFRFLFVCEPLDPSVLLGSIEPHRWYLTPGD
jgi:hypothetical protein